MWDARRRCGFTLVEIMIVVMIIGLLAALAIPAMSKARINAQATRTASDYLTFEAAFEQYAMAEKGWPPDAMRGTIPPGMESYLRGDLFTQTTPIGGNWDWDVDEFGFQAGVSIVDTTADDVILERIAALLDDGSLTTGRFRRTAPNRYTLIMEE